MQAFCGRGVWCVAMGVLVALACVTDLCGEAPASSAVRSPEQIRAAVEGLSKGDVAWREVRWQTCLINGLAESRRTNKPVMLWIFIDRPIDDERC